MTIPLFLDDAYRQNADGRVLSASPDGGIVLDQSLFYPTSGGQPGDTGHLSWDGGSIGIGATVKTESGIALMPEEGAALPAPGAVVRQEIDWDRRYAFMQVHTALHLLSVVIPRPVTGGAISSGKGRLDFDMEAVPEERDTLEARLNALVVRDLPVTEDWITEAELDARPDLVKTLSVAPPRGAGRIRLIRIGAGSDQVDLQPCGGTHVRSTGEIGRLRLGKIEKKGRLNRRVYLHLDGTPD